MRFVSIVAVGLAALAVPAGTSAAPAPAPACPQVEGWAPSGRPLTIDSGLHFQFRCVYAQPGHSETATFDAFWWTPAARDADVDFHECGKASGGGSYYRTIWSGKSFVEIEYGVGGGNANAALFQAERERLDRAALALMASTENLAKSCTKAAVPSVRDTTRPAVRVHRAGGPAGGKIAFPFSVADDSGRINVVLTIYDGRAKAKTLVRKRYGWARSGSYTVRLRLRSVGRHYWCVAATDAARNTRVACGTVVVA